MTNEADGDVVVAEGKFVDLALHYVNKYNMMAVRLMSKWDVRRLARATAATAAIAATVLPKMTPPTSEELGMYVILFSTYTPTHNRIRRK